MRKQILSIVTILLVSTSLSAQNFFIQEDFSSGAVPTGWTNTAVSGSTAWSFGIDGSTTNAGQNNIDGTTMAYFDDDDLGSGAVNNRADLLTSVFDNSSSASTMLSFDYNFREFSGPLDSFLVSVFDGTNWVQVFGTGSNDCGNYLGACAGNFPRANIDISAYANTNCQVRFTYYDGDDWCWYVGLDNVVISAPFPNDIGVNLISDPISSCGLTNAQPVQVQIKNFGSAAATGFDVVIDTNGVVVHTETVTASIAGGDSLTYNFTGTLNLQRIAFYNLTAYTNYNPDSNNNNDSVTVTIENEPIFSPSPNAFTDNFEGIDRWKIEGQNPSWSRGAPNSANFNSVTSGTNAYVTRLNGNYNSNENSYLVSPCFDFSGAIGDPIVSFNLNHRTEPTFDRLVFEVSTNNGLSWQIVNPGGVNPTNWYTATAQYWEGNSGGWIPVENVLTGLAGQSAVKFRFKFTSDVSGVQDGIAIDDFSVRYPQPIDISLNKINYPSTVGAPLCGLGASENIIVELENKGANAIDTVFMFYRINSGSTVADTLIQNIPSNTLYTYTFPTKYNFLGQTSLNIDVWAVATNDGFNPNDSILNRTISNSVAGVQTLPFRENFNGPSWVAGTGNAGGNSLVAPPWSRTSNQTGFGNYSWRVNTTDNTFNTGPASGNGGSGKMLHVFSNTGAGGTVAILESPCIDLGNNAGAILEYFYHRFGPNMPALNLDVYDGSQWILGYDVVTAQPQTAKASPWTKQTVNLSQFAGRRIKIRWRVRRFQNFGGGNVGIDDVEIFEPIPQDGKVASLVSPVTGCTPSGTITAEIENFGSAPLTNIPVAFSIDNGTVIRDTVPGTLAAGTKINHTFPVTGNFAAKGTTFNITVWTEVLGDLNLFNDRLSSDITNTTRNFTYIEDFEGFTDGSCVNATNANAADVLNNGWTETSTNSYQWHVQDAALCGGTGSGGTGPNSDHTTGTGIFMFTEGSGASGQAQIVSPCIDFKSRAGAAMKFWYHKFGASMGTLFVDIFADGVWNNGVFSIPGSTHTSEGAPWLEAIAKFNQFGGKDLQVRFRAVHGGGFSNDMAIDDISFFAPAGYDARMLAVTGPESGCDIASQSFISVEVDNFGVNNINANSDSLLLYYQVDTLPPVKDTFNLALLSEQSATFTFSTPADLSENGKTYLIKTWTALKGEEDVTNDTLFAHKIINNTKTTDYYEDFELFRDAACDAKLGQVLQEGWAETSAGSYSWHVQSSLCGKGAFTTPTSATGPQGDRTTGSGMFMFTEGNGTGTAVLESPCIDLSGNTNPRLSFFYHRYGANMSSLSVDVLFNGTWVNGVASLTGQNQTSAIQPWKQETVDLSPYVGGLVQVRFRSVKGFGTRSDMAIDDVFLHEAIAKDAGITEVIQPNGDACGLASGSVEVNIENFGTADINPGELVVQYNNNGGPFEKDTIQQTILAGASLNYTFNTPVDLSNPGRQLIYANTILLNDSLPQNDHAFKTVINRQPGIPRYVMDFEDLVMGVNAAGDPVYGADQLKGFTRFPANGGPGTFMWHVVSGPGPYIDGQPPMPPGPPTGPSGDHTFATNRVNGAGTYVLMETDLKQLLAPNPAAIPDATLELPCGPMDFSTSKEGNVILSFWYHMFGPESGNLYIDVHDGTNWVLGVDVIRGQQQSDDTSPWLNRKVVMNRFVGLPSVRIRLRAETAYVTGNPGSGRGGDIGVDDIEILDRAKKDAAAFSLLEPSSDCALSASERFRIRVQNLGTEDILSLNYGYQITFTPYGGSAQTLPVVRDSSIGNTIVPLAFYDFSFNNIDMSAPGRYVIKYWTEYRGEQHLFNDTLTEIITNTARPFPSCDDFSDLVFGNIAKDYKDGVLPNDWDGNENAYTFVASIEGDPAVPDLKGHTGGLNDVFLLAVDPVPFAGNARIQSACWDLTNTPAANLEFWYVMPAASGGLEIAIASNGGGFLPIDTIQGVEGVARAWTRYEAVLADFVGATVQVQFRTLSPGGSYYAIDDVCIKRPDPQQILFNSFVNPAPNRCFYSNAEPISIRVRNIGVDIIDSFQVVIALDEDIIGNPRGSNGWRDTIWVRPGLAPPFFNPGELFTFTINDPNFLLDLSAYKDYYINAWILLDGDKDTTNNLRLDYQITHGDPEDLPYVEDFETPTLLALSTHPQYNWAIGQAWALDQPPFGISGPELDHTLGPVDTTGNVLTSQGVPSNLGSLIAATSPCIDLINTVSPELKYWYHMFGFSMGTLTLQINDDNGWVTMETLNGEDPDQRFGGRTAWKSRIVDLSAYRGKVVRYRFVSSCGSDFASNMAIDDISVYDAAAIDLAPVGLNEPNSDSTQCYSENNPLSVDIINNGSDSLNLENDTVSVTVVISKDGIVFETFIQEFYNNTWVSRDGLTLPTPRDSIFTLQMDSTFDMSDTGSFYRFDITVEVDGDLIQSNNEKNNLVVKSQRKIGDLFASSVLPNDTVCWGDQVQLRIRNHFGAVTWQESRVNPDGSSTNFISNFRQRNLTYVQSMAGSFLIDSTAEIRARICNQLFLDEGIDETTDSVRIEVLKPFRAKAFGSSRCENEPVGDTVKVELQSNINGVIYYDRDPRDQSNDPSVPRVQPLDTVRTGPDYFLPIKNRLTATTTYYVETMIEYPNIQPNGLTCVTKLDADKVPVDVVVATIPVVPFGSGPDTVFCGPGSGSILNQGAVFFVELDSGRQDTYNWTFKYPAHLGGRVVTDTVNTSSFAVDPWRMDVNKNGSFYELSVAVVTDSNCRVTAGTDTTIRIIVLDDCTVGIEDSELSNDLEIYPNPVSDVLTISHTSLENFNGSIFLMSAEGRLIQSFEELTFGQLNHEIDMKKLPKGVYFIKIETDEGTVVQKVIKS